MVTVASTGIENCLDYDERENADKRLQKRLEKKAKQDSSFQVLKSDLWHLKNLRNAVLHGTFASSDKKVKRAINSLEDFKDIFDKGSELFDRVLSNEI